MWKPVLPSQRFQQRGPLTGAAIDRTALFSAVIRAVQKCSLVFKESVFLIATFVATLLLFEWIITASQSNCCFMNSFVELCWNVLPGNWLLFCTQSSCIFARMLINCVAWQICKCSPARNAHHLENREPNSHVSEIIIENHEKSLCASEQEISTQSSDVMNITALYTPLGLRMQTCIPALWNWYAGRWHWLPGLCFSLPLSSCQSCRGNETAHIIWPCCDHVQLT